MRPQPDIQELIALCKQQYPDRPDVVNSLENCTTGYWSDQAYYRFVDSKNANQPGAIWQHHECIVLEQENDADIVLDLLKDGRIGGIEFIGLING
jgi:hypothetical protein